MKVLKNNIGSITATIGLVLLVILTYGNLAEINTIEYWQNVTKNIAGIGLLSIGLSMTQLTIKQGVAEQALRSGLNKKLYLKKVDSQGNDIPILDAENRRILDPACTPARFNEHYALLEKCRTRDKFLPFYLAEYNRRETIRRKEDFLLENEFKDRNGLPSEEALLEIKFKWWQIKNKLLKKKYLRIRTNITADNLKWSTTDIEYDEQGNIRKLSYHRRKRLIKGVFMSILSMGGAAFVAAGLFIDAAEVPVWQKTIKFFSYLIIIAITVIMSVVKEYEKGSIGVANELGQVNNIWLDFDKWEPTAEIEEKVNERERRTNIGANAGVKSKEIQVAETPKQSGLLGVADSSGGPTGPGSEQLYFEFYGDNRRLG